MDFNAMHYYSIRIPVAFYVTDTGRLAFRQLFASFLTDATASALIDLALRLGAADPTGIGVTRRGRPPIREASH